MVLPGPSGRDLGRLEDVCWGSGVRGTEDLGQGIPQLKMTFLQPTDSSLRVPAASEVIDAEAQLLLLP